MLGWIVRLLQQKKIELMYNFTNIFNTWVRIFIQFAVIASDLLKIVTSVSFRNDSLAHAIHLQILCALNKSLASFLLPCMASRLHRGRPTPGTSNEADNNNHNHNSTNKTRRLEVTLRWWFFPTHLKNMRKVKLDHFPK